MAVFTRITHDELNAWLAGRPCGSLQSFEGISSGIENTNYFVNTSTGRYVLTIFEKLQVSELPFYLGLMGHLSSKGLPVPGPVASQAGDLYSMLKGKPATLVNCLQGHSVEAPNGAQCAAIGQFIALAHLAVLDFDGQLPNPRGLNWIQEATGRLVQHAPEHVLALLSDEVAHQSRIAASAAYRALPKGAVHADLFRDNALMDGDTLGGVIDFYFAGIDTFLFDLAVTVNDWCIDLNTGALDAERTAALLAGYQKHRPLHIDEQALWQDMLRSAALRFWTSRLVDYYMPRDAEVLHVKDPSHFERVLKARRAGCPACQI
ncbi:homoserine kinase [Limnobacter humi]|uniref:Homoserine kinase n=1 Tax=Limnobacter humi TaxID=1778671 RepID=A0ABT1WI59_9BURK|nr:homoserine kinase [Limnobacter humi]MCQ8896558.1 homoserine kinase [Limnobacter humi]